MLYLITQEKKICANLFNRLNHSSAYILLDKILLFAGCGFEEKNKIDQGNKKLKFIFKCSFI